MTEQRDGIYFGLPEDLYHADPALGSGAIKQLAYSAADYWFNSPHNPARPETNESAALILGRAYHKMVLEGRAALEASFAPKLLKWNTKEGKVEQADFEKRGVIGIPVDDWNRILIAGASVHGNPFLRDAFVGGPTEVSIFWQRHGVRCKSRIDCLKGGANTDLKTIEPDSYVRFPDACIRHMGRYYYHVQTEHYNDGRRQIGRFLEAGKVYGNHNKKFLATIAATESWASVFVFLKKKDAPLSWATSISSDNPLCELARGTIDQAIETYSAYREKYGFDAAWLEQEPIRELHTEDLPPWMRTL